MGAGNTPWLSIAMALDSESDQRGPTGADKVACPRAPPIGNARVHKVPHAFPPTRRR